MSNELLRADILASWSRVSSFQEQGALLNRCYVALGEQQGAPAGYVMVPVEPTPEMLDCIMDWQKIGNVTAYRAMLAAAPVSEAKAQGVVIPEGWIPLTIEHEPGYPEDVAFGPKRMMDRLKKWLDRYFEMRLDAAPKAEPQPVSDDARDAGLVDALEQITRMTYDEWTNGAVASRIAEEALATYRAAQEKK